MTDRLTDKDTVPGYDEEEGSTPASRNLNAALEDFDVYIRGGLVVINDSEAKSGENFVLLSPQNEARINQMTEQLRSILRGLHEMRDTK